MTGLPPSYFFQSLSFTQHETLVWLDWSASELWLLVSSSALLPVLRLQTCAWLAFPMGDGGSGLSHPLVPKSVLFKDDNQVLRTLHSIPPPCISYFSHNTASPFPPHLVPFLRTFLLWTCLYSLLGPKVTRFLRD